MADTTARYAEVAVRGAMRRSGIDTEAIDRVIDTLRAGRPRTGERIEVAHAALIEADGRRLSVAKWAALTGISEWTIRSRLRAGWDPALAVTTPARRYGDG